MVRVNIVTSEKIAGFEHRAQRFTFSSSTAELQLDMTSKTSRQKLISQQTKGVTIRDHRWKALGKENSDLLGIFCQIFLTSFFKITLKILPKQKYTWEIKICLVEYSSFEVSDPSEVPRIVGQLFF